MSAFAAKSVSGRTSRMAMGRGSNEAPLVFLLVLVAYFQIASTPHGLLVTAPRDRGRNGGRHSRGPRGASRLRRLGPPRPGLARRAIDVAIDGTEQAANRPVRACGSQRGSVHAGAFCPPGPGRDGSSAAPSALPRRSPAARRVVEERH